jgi:hypothetical protein
MAKEINTIEIIKGAVLRNDDTFYTRGLRDRC